VTSFGRAPADDATDAAPPPAGLFYGWVIVAVMAAVGALSMALGSLNFGVFIKPMGDELGVGRAVFGWAQSSRQFASAVTAPVVGGLIDRFGVRVLMTVAALTTGGALVCLAVVSEGWQIVALFAIMGIVGMSGPGALVTSVPVTKWFVRQRARALAYMSLGIPIGGLLFVPLTQVFIDAYGWRMAWVLLALLGTGLIVPLSLIFVRREPEDLGLLPDGERRTPDATPQPVAREVGPVAPDDAKSGTDGERAPSILIPSGTDDEVRERTRRREEVLREGERSWTRAEAVRSGTFWRLIFVFSIVMLATNSVGVHRIASFMDRGFDARLISYATALDAAAAGLSTFAMGMLARRVAPRYIGAGGFLMLMLASILTVLAETHLVMLLAMIVFGLGIGVLMLMQNYLWAEYFGRRHLGSIRGAVTPITLLFGGAGPPIAGYVRDATGSYTEVWLVAIVLMALGAVVMALTPPPRSDLV